MKSKNLTKNKKLYKPSKRILSGEEPLKLTDAKGIAKEAFNSANIGNTIGGMASGIGTVVEASLANAKIDTSKADNAIDAINSYEPINTNLKGITSGYNALDFNSDIKAKDMTVSVGEGVANMGKAGLAGFTTGLQTGGIWGGIAGLVGGLGASGGAWWAASSQAKDIAEQKRIEERNAEITAYNKATTATDTYFKNEYDNFMINQAAYGGPLYNHSGDWSNGLTFINEGGTHEENPFDGVLMGFDQEGIPNLVEEGEIIYNDYVFSNILKPSKKQLESSGLNKKYNDWTFAKIVEDLQKPSAETPLDKISKESLDDMMATIINMQEEVRMKKGLTGENRLMKFGGRKYNGLQDFRKKLSETKTSIMEDLNDVDLSTPESKTTFGDIVNLTGMLSPTIEGIGKLISNATKPVDKSNFVSEKAHKQRPKANLDRINVQPKLQLIDENAFVVPIINQGRAVAKDIQNLGTTGADVMNRLALNAYNTQNAIGKGLIDITNQNWIRQQQYDNMLAELQKANVSIDQSEFALNDAINRDIALGKIADAAAIESVENAKLAAQDELSANVTQGIADLTRQNIEWNWIKNNPQYAEAVAAIHGKKANGGMLTRKKRRK